MKTKLQLVTFPTKKVKVKCNIHGVQKVVSIPSGGVACEKCVISLQAEEGWEIEFLMFLGDWLIRTKGQPHSKEEMEIVHKIRYLLADQRRKWWENIQKITTYKFILSGKTFKFKKLDDIFMAEKI